MAHHEELDVVAGCASAVVLSPAEILRHWFAGLGESARTKYGVALRQFETWATGTADPRPETALRLLVDADLAGARQLVLGWRESMESAGKASGTVAGNLSALTSLVTAARRGGLVEWHLESVVPDVVHAADRTGADYVSRLHDFVAAAAERGIRKAVRDCAIVSLMREGGIKRSAIASLLIGDVDIDGQGAPAVVFRKHGGRRHRSQIGRRSADDLRRWLSVRGSTDHAKPVFVRTRAAGEKPTRLCGDAIRRMLEEWSKDAGVPVVRPSDIQFDADRRKAATGEALGTRSTENMRLVVDAVAALSKAMDGAGRDEQIARATGAIKAIADLMDRIVGDRRG